MAAAPRQAAAADQPVEGLADGPEAVQVVVTVIPADGRHHRPDIGGGGLGNGAATGALGVIGVVDATLAHVEGSLGPAGQDLLFSFRGEGGRDGFPEVQQMLGDQPPQFLGMGIEVVLEALDQGPGDVGRHGGDEAQPVGGELGRQDRQGDDAGRSSARRLGEDAHHPGVGQDLGAGGVEDGVGGLR